MLRLRLTFTVYPHWAKYSGFYQFVKHLDASHFNVALHPTSNSDDDFLVRNQRVRGWFRRLLRRQRMDWYKLSDLHAELRLFCRCCLLNVDVVHFLDGEHAPLFFPLLSRLPRWLRPAIIVTYHQPAHLLDTLVPKTIFPYLDAITLVSAEQLPIFKGLVPPEKLHVILHGIDTSFYRPAYSLQSDTRFNCITVGHWLRDFPAIAEVATMMQEDRSVHFHIVASPPPTGFEHLKSLTLYLEGLKNVTFYKGVSDDEFVRLYHESHLLFLPLIQSTANNSLLEGIACGLPVVSTDLPSVRAYVPGKEAILVKENSAPALMDAVLRLKNDPVEYRRRATAARKRAEELDWHKIAPQYEALYRSVTRRNLYPHAAAGPIAREPL
jgi:glycosyltransferase involved in cell wall biosynthesis